jgi:hypothetical protein
MPDCTGRVSLISWASAPEAINTSAGDAIAAARTQMALPEDIRTMAITSSVVAGTAATSTSQCYSTRRDSVPEPSRVPSLWYHWTLLPSDENTSRTLSGL